MRNYPILYTAQDFAVQGASDTYDNGVGMLSDVISTKVTEALNDEYEFEFKYPVNGIHYEDIQLQNVVVVKANLRDRTQPFRIYKITKPINGIVTVNAQHISYDLNGIPVLPFGAEDCTSAMAYMNQNGNLIGHNFVFTTDKSTVAPFVSDVPRSARALLGGYEGSLLDIYGGHYHFDRYTVEMLDDRGIDQGISIRYGKNLEDISDEHDSSQAYTSVLPYWRYTDSEDESNNYTVIGPIITALGSNPGITKVKVVDFTEDYEEEPSLIDLQNSAEDYMNEYGINVPTRNISLSYADDPDAMNMLGLADPVNIYCINLGINLKSRCIKVVFNPMENRNERVEFGELRSNIANTIVDINTNVNEDRKQQILESREITKRITERLDGFQVAIDSKANSTEVDVALGQIRASVSESSLDNIKSMIAEMNAEEFRLLFNTIKSNFVQDPNGVLTTSVSAITKYIKAINGSLVFGVSDDGTDTGTIKLKLEHDKIFFFTGSDDTSDLKNAFAYMTNNIFYVDKMNAATSVQIGNDGTVNYLWIKRDNGHLTLQRQ